MKLPIVQVDAFTSEPFRGNPAAVCVLPGPADPAWMQKVALEMNLSETAFLHREDGCWRLRWFTPAFEIDLCGHATLASAHALWEAGESEEVLRFQTKSGELRARRTDELIELDFPVLQPERCGEIPAALSAALPGVSIRGCYRAGKFLTAELAQVRNLQPNFTKITKLGGFLLVTAQGDGQPYHFESRFFAPKAGIPEDPVTGSAHCVLTPLWAQRLGLKKMKAYQASARGGELEVELCGDRVLLRGRAVTVLRGELLH